MNTEARRRWAEVEHWLDQALARPEGERGIWLAAQPLDPALREEVAELLAAEHASRAFATGMPPPPALREGEQVGVWRVQALVGRGGSGEVYRVQRSEGGFEQTAALKLLRHADDPDELRRFSAERRLLARLQDPAIARLIDGGAHQGRLYAVLEFVDGEPFDVFAARLPLAGRVALFLEVVEAVAAAHAQGIVHRDLKPANVLVEAQGSPRLLDFGIARLADGDPLATGEIDPTVALRLTPAYCAPEQLLAGAVGPAADVYALGVMLYQVLAGSLPWSLEGSGVQRSLRPFPTHRTWAGAASWIDARSRLTSSLRRKPV